MIGAGLDVTVLGYPAEYPSGGRACDFKYIGVVSSLSRRRAKTYQEGERILGNYWRFLIEPMLVCREAFSPKFAGFDRYYITHLEPLAVYPLARRISSRRDVVYAMIPTVFYSRSALRGRPFSSKARAWLSHRAISRLASSMQIVANSRYVFQLMGMEGRPGVHVVPEGYENFVESHSRAAARARLELPGDRRMLLLLGVASRAKGADTLFDAMRQIEPSFELCVVGQTGGVYEASWGDIHGLRERGWRIRIDERFVPESVLHDYYAASDGVVIPYRRGFATTSTHLRRASEYGKFIIACDQYLLGEIVRDYDLGLLFEPENVEDLASRLREFSLQPRSRLDQVRANSLKVIDAYSWDRIGMRYRDLFSDSNRCSAGESPTCTR